MKKVEGVCHLCGSFGPLSWEHVPPRAAFNDRPMLCAKVEKLLGGQMAEELEHPTGGISRRGAGAYTLCESCNSKTGAWYGRGYTAWAYEGFGCWSTRDERLQCTTYFSDPPCR